MKKNRRHTEAAARVSEVIVDLHGFLPGKVKAYGAAHEIQPRLWRILLEPYRNGSAYQIPAHIVREIPRLTRCLDRVLRIVNAPDDGDPHGEHPWLDLAGDAIAGEATRRAWKAADDLLMLGLPPMPPIKENREGPPDRRTTALGPPVIDRRKGTRERRELP